MMFIVYIYSHMSSAVIKLELIIIMNPLLFGSIQLLFVSPLLLRLRLPVRVRAITIF